jgi:hypothetical protein
MSADEVKATVDIYKMLVDMADKVSQRRQTANSFYLSVNTALIGAGVYMSSAGGGAINIILLAVAGWLVSLFWIRNIETYKDLNSGKFAVITEIEKSLPLAPYTAEWETLKRGDRESKYRSFWSKYHPFQNKYRPFHEVEVAVPLVFVLLHAVQLARLVKW